MSKSKIATFLESETSLLDEIEAIMREMGPDETLYSFTIREPDKGAFLLRWLLKSVAETSSERDPGEWVH